MELNFYKHLYMCRFMDPLTRGEYPQDMRTYLGNRLPNFTKVESEYVNGSYDFIGVNYYDAFYAFALPLGASINSTYLNDSRVGLTGDNFKNAHTCRYLIVTFV